MTTQVSDLKIIFVWMEIQETSPDYVDTYFEN